MHLGMRGNRAHELLDSSASYALRHNYLQQSLVHSKEQSQI